MRTTHLSSPHPTIGSPYNLESVEYQGCKIYRAFFRTHPDKLSELLPDGVEPLEPGVLFVYGADLPMQGSAGIYGGAQDVHSYKEYGLVVPSRIRRQNGVITETMYALELFLDPYKYAAPGRERWGWPKKDCEGNIKVAPSGTSIELDFSRGGHLLAQLEIKFPQPIDQSKLPEPAKVEETWVNWKTIPSVTGQGLDVNQLTEAILPVTVLSYCEGTVEQLDLHNGPADYLVEAFPIVESVKAVYLEANFSLPNGAVVFDYLNSDSGS